MSGRSPWPVESGGSQAVFCSDRLNATVIGSKGAKEGDEPAEGEEESAPAGEANGEAKEAMEEAVQGED